MDSGYPDQYQMAEWVTRMNAVGKSLLCRPSLQELYYRGNFRHTEKGGNFLLFPQLQSGNDIVVLHVCKAEENSEDVSPTILLVGSASFSLSCNVIIVG